MAYRLENIKFVNTREFAPAARTYEKYGHYTLLNPKQDKREWKLFWDEEEKRRREGYSVGGVRITGAHYTYLNYFRIKKVDVKTSKQVRELGGATKIKAEKKEFFPDFYDHDYHYFHALEYARGQGKNLCVGKSRRKGFSYKNANVVTNMYDLIPNSLSIIGAHDTKYLYPEGTMAMVKTGLSWLNQTTDWRKRRLIDKAEHFKSGININGEDLGYLSQVMALSFNNNTGAARGKDAQLILLEEAGKFPNLLPSYIETQATTEAGTAVTGQILVFGTGGGEDTNWAGFEELFYNPDKYNMLAFDNVWDDDASNTTCGFFCGYQHNLEGFMDDDGNSLIRQATEYSKAQKLNLEKNAAEVETIEKYSMEYPLKPSEAFKRSGNNLFPVAAIDRRLNYIKQNGLTSLARHGTLVRDNGKVILMTNNELKLKGLEYHPPLTTAHLDTSKDTHGCFTEWQAPYIDPQTGLVPDNLYRIWHDPYATDRDKKEITFRHSTGQAYIYERPNNITASRGNCLVGVLGGRPPRLDTYNEQLFLAAERYNAKIFFENDRGDVIGYAKRKHLTSYLENEPTMLLKKDEQSITRVSRNWGMSMDDGTGRRKSNGVIFLRDWLTEIVSKDSSTGEVKMVLDYIFDEALLEELLKWSLKGNFDRVSALLVGMYDIKEKENMQVKVSKPKSTTGFFSRNLF